MKNAFTSVVTWREGIWMTKKEPTSHEFHLALPIFISPGFHPTSQSVSDDRDLQLAQFGSHSFDFKSH